MAYVADRSFGMRIIDASGCPCPGNADANMRVDLMDVISVASHWTADYGIATGPGDANADGQVNHDDNFAVILNWLRECP